MMATKAEAMRARIRRMIRSLFSNSIILLFMVHRYSYHGIFHIQNIDFFSSYRI